MMKFIGMLFFISSITSKADSVERGKIMIYHAFYESSECKYRAAWNKTK